MTKAARTAGSFVRTLLILCACAIGSYAVVAQEPAFVAEELAESIYLMRPADERTDLTNSLLVVRNDGLLVVEAQAAPAAARELLEAISRVSSKPIRYLVLSHAHAEAAGGAGAFPDSTLVIGSIGARDALSDPTWDFGAELATDMKRTDARKPVLVIQARTDLEDPLNKVEIFPLGHAHTTTDLFVVVPGANLIYAGAVLFVDRNPYAESANVHGWLAALNYLAKLRPAIVVPLRGAPVDVRGVRTARQALAWLRGQVEMSFIDGIEPERIPGRILASEEFTKYFDPDASPSYTRGLVEQVVAEAVEQRRKRGVM